jgi:hypothetical protein
VYFCLINNHDQSDRRFLFAIRAGVYFCSAGRGNGLACLQDKGLLRVLNFCRVMLARPIEIQWRMKQKS